METVPADAAFLAIAGRYYVRRCNDMDPEESLQDGTKGPASFARATGALLLEAPNFCNPRATITMKGIANTATGADYTSELSPPWNGPAKRLDGKFTFQMDVERLKLFGDLKLRISRKVDANGDAILVGDYLFQEGDKDTDKEWNERVRCFRAPADTDEVPPPPDPHPEQPAERGRLLKAKAKEMAHLLNHKPFNPYCDGCNTAKMRGVQHFCGAYQRKPTVWGRVAHL